MRRNDWVLRAWGTERVRCPYHGLLDAEQAYVPGLAVCGCVFVQGPGGLLRAIAHTPRKPTVK